MEQYPPWVGLVYIFNLIVGTGALTIPAAFANAGWLISIFILLLLAFVSFITVTFVIESIACANATIQWRRIQLHNINESEPFIEYDSENDSEETAIIQSNKRYYYNLNTKIELGEIAALYLNKIGYVLCFICLCVYLFGDLSIYAAASGKMIVTLTCKNNNDTEDYTVKCWDSYSITKMNIYRVFVAVFAFSVGPFAYFKVQKTKHIQFFTIALRWFAFIVMVTVASFRIVNYGPQGHPNLINIKELPALAGSTLYSFMCHHSLPSLIAPMSNKNYIMKKISLDFICICIFYLVLALTASFAFKHLDVLYSLNFLSEKSGIMMRIVGYCVAIFPLFVISTSFPILAITLQNNLKFLILDHTTEGRSFFVEYLLFPTISVLTPTVVALCTHNLKWLLEVTGAYAGVMVQYVIPTVLVFYARRHCVKDFGIIRNSYTSPFKHRFWFLFIITWSIICILFVSVNFIIN